ncbi:right-handed parallel beta-helix repeat-containing protein [Salipaludibacillus sp. HK11]|uniref:right-handed parallel beta-helix repeat-containing protein n=1 Tax=Salipaludibacillus sp. HK11 TaxID=3394320 RepID=UPI0039FDC056
MSITNYLTEIKNAIYGKDVRQAIHDAIKGTYDDAAKEGNANMEVSLARGDNENLNERLDKNDQRVTTTNEQLAQIATYKVFSDMTKNEIQEVINKASKVFFEPSTYDVEEILLKDNIEIDFQGSTLRLLDNQEEMVSILKKIEGKNITLKNVILDGNRTSNSTNTGAQDGGNHGLSLTSVSGLWLHNVVVVNCGSDGLYLGEVSVDKPSKGVFAYDCVFDNNMRQGMSITNLENGHFHRCSFLNTNGKSPEAGVDLEPNHADSILNNIEFIDCKFKHNNGRGFVMDVRKEQTYNNIVLINCESIDNGSDDIRVTGGNNTILRGFKIDGGNYGDLSFSTNFIIEKGQIINAVFDTVSISQLHEFDFIRSKIESVLFTGDTDTAHSYRQINFYTCTLDGKNNRTVVFNCTNTGDFSITLDNCLFKNSIEEAVRNARNMTLINCDILDCGISEPLAIITPRNSENINTKIIKCVFTNNNNVQPIRFPSNTTGLKVVNAITDIAIPEPSTGNDVIETILI